MKGGAVGFERALVLDPALDEIEGDLRQPPLGELVQVFDVDDAVEAHGSAFPRIRSARMADRARAGQVLARWLARSRRFPPRGRAAPEVRPRFRAPHNVPGSD